MIKQDIPLYKLDLTGKSEFNHVKLQAGSRFDVAQHQIVIPPGAPFYQKSMKITDPSGKLLVLGEDYEFYGIMNKLTAFTAQPVGLFIRFLKDEIREWVWDYQVVGNFNKLTSEILNMLHSIYEDDRYVFWENIKNKPLWFDPEVHQHDLVYDIFGFTDLARELNRVAHIQGTQKAAADGFLEAFRDHIDFYCKSYRELLQGMINNHGTHKYDQHAVRKEHIGLALVDDYPTATLEETLEGLRDDLFITPYNAALAVSAAAGRNDKLYPSGKLPLLRYGSDTFIPPTISGSFEGLGAQTRRVGGLIESDGTMLILQHRNNGKYRGLYFVRCSNWSSQNAEYEFTSYMYTHPTATADGATLDTIINGSNRYIMVVGDAVKNIWYYAETNGTFNPDRHILRRISGPWVTEDMANRPNYWSTNLETKCVVLADENYAQGWSIIQTYSIQEFSKRRTLPHPPEWYWTRSMNIDNAGYSIIYFKNLSALGVRCRIDYTHEVFGNKNDYYFTPWWPEVVDDGTGKGANISSLFARYTRPTKYLWMHRSLHAMWLKAADNIFNLRFSITGIDDAGASGRRFLFPTFRGQLKFEQVGAEQWCRITPHPEMTMPTINPDDRNDSNPTYKSWMEGFNAYEFPDGADRIGSFVVDKEFLHFSDGFGNSIFPSVYCMLRVPYLKDADALYRKAPAGSVTRHYKQGDGRLVFNEANPLGLTESFVLQRWLSADSTNYTQTGFLIKQNTPAGPEWIFRHSRYANPNWTHLRPTMSSSFGGKAYSHWPFVSTVRKTNLGQQVRFNQTVPPPNGSSTNNCYTHLFGASCQSTVMGTNKGVNAEGTRADYLLPWLTKTSIVDSILQFQHQEVFNVKRLVEQDLLAVFGSLGYTLTDIRKTWSVSQTMDPSGGIRFVAAVNRIVDRNIYTSFAIGTVVGQGATSTVDGYKLWADAKWTSLSPVRTVVNSQYVELGTGYSHWDQNSKDSAKLNHGMCLTIPWTNRFGDGTVSSYESYTIYLRQCQGYFPAGGDDMPAVLIEVSADSRTILNAAPTFGGMWTMANSIEPIPESGAMRTQYAIEVFEGSAIAGGLITSDRVYDGMLNDTYNPNGGYIGATNIITPAYTVYFNEIKNILLAGKMYDIPSTYIDILDQDPSPAGKTFYIYVRYSNNIAEYDITPSVRPESSVQSMIGIVICGPTQIDRIIPYNRFSMNGVVISAKRQGSAILASSGSSEGAGDTSTILLDNDFIP